MNLNYYMPTKVIMSSNCIRENGAIFASLGKKAMIVTGFQSAKINGALEDVTTAMKQAGVSYVIYDKVMNNPTIDCAYDGAAFAKENGVEFIVGIGGGSPMDAAKAMALLASQEIEPDHLFSGDYLDQVLPMIMIPTTAGTGSEVTQYSILTNDKVQSKTSISSPYLFPKYALLDGKYMSSLSLVNTIHTAVDALSHSVEGMLTKRATVISDLLALESIERITKVFPALLKWKESGENLSIEERDELLYGSTLAGMVIAHTGTTVVHSMGYSLTYFKDVDHGRANGLILPSFLNFVAKQEVETVNRMLKAMGYTSLMEMETMIVALLGEREPMTEDEINHYTEIAMNAKNVLNSRITPSKEDVLQMYVRCL